MKNNPVHNFLLYGDNFLECERFVDEVLCNPNSKLQFKKDAGKYLDRPILVFQDRLTKDELRFHLRPYYESWKSSPLKKYMNENLDVFLFHIQNGNQLPILAVEYDDATQAGNQAWQRSNRGADAAKPEDGSKSIPYMYVIPKESMEYNENGTPKALRYPSFLTPLSFITLSCWSRQISLLITHDIKTNKETQKKVATIASYLIRRTYCPTTKKPYKELEDLYGEILSYTEECAGWNKSHIWQKHAIMKNEKRKLNSKKISMAILDEKNIPHEIDLSKISARNFNSTNFLPYTKMITLKLRKKFWTDVYHKLVYNKKRLAEYQKVWGKDQFNHPAMPTGFGDYQTCIIYKKRVLQNILVEAYPAIKTDITQFFNLVSGPVVIFHFLAGYKPSGTSRPDTGYLAFMQSLFPNEFQKQNSIVIIYSADVPKNWRQRQDHGENEFWNSVSKYTGLVIVDKYQQGRQN